MVTSKGWLRIGPDPAIAAWASAAHPAAVQALRETDQLLRCGGTWAVGLDLLPNAPDGSIGGVALPWDRFGLTPEPLHRAQLSTITPGYPQPAQSETAVAFAFRKTRDAAHLDGLLPIGPKRQRMLKEPHGFVLGLPLTRCGAGAAPLVVWEGSHEILRTALKAALAPYAPDTWADIDLTEPYAIARREVFARCTRVELSVQPGQATLLHRLVLHGVAPWAPKATAPPEGRIIAYFRSLLASVQDWLLAP